MDGAARELYQPRQCRAAGGRSQGQGVCGIFDGEWQRWHELCIACAWAPPGIAPLRRPSARSCVRQVTPARLPSTRDGHHKRGHLTNRPHGLSSGAVALVQCAPRTPWARSEPGHDEVCRLLGDRDRASLYDRWNHARLSARSSWRSSPGYWPLFIAWHFSAWLVSPHLGGLLADEQVRPWAARIILFIAGAASSAAIAGLLIGHFVRLSLFSGMDRFLGLRSACMRGAIVLGVVVIVCQLVRLDSERWWQESLLVPYVERVANGCAPSSAKIIIMSRESAAPGNALTDLRGERACAESSASSGPAPSISVCTMRSRCCSTAGRMPPAS